MFIEFTQGVDLAQIVLYMFWAFFAALIMYLHRESKREGYPLIADGVNGSVRSLQGFPSIPEPKTFLLPHGGEVQAPGGPAKDTRNLPLEKVAPYFGAPFAPTGDPMRDQVGAASYADRADEPDLLADGAIKIVPLRVAGDYHVSARDKDPRGWSVVDAKGVEQGTITDLWVDQAEFLFRYFEMKTKGGRTVLIPVPVAFLSGGKVKVHALIGDQFEHVPTTKNPDSVTLLEEDKIMGYFGGGYLYASPERQEPFI